jgi:hypothetical protein
MKIKEFNNRYCPFETLIVQVIKQKLKIMMYSSKKYYFNNTKLIIKPAQIQIIDAQILKHLCKII